MDSSVQLPPTDATKEDWYVALWQASINNGKVSGLIWESRIAAITRGCKPRASGFAGSSPASPIICVCSIIVTYVSVV